jgi:hypothetical protein
MTLIRIVLLTSGLILTVYGRELLAQSSAPDATSTSASRPLLTLQMPALPEPVRVVLKPATTALLVSDMCPVFFQ